MKDEFLDNLLAKFNTRAVSMLCAFVLICGGIYMCFSDISATGSINLKAAFIEGKIETGSLGLMAMFLGVLIVLALNLHKPYKGQEIKITINGNEVSAKGLSFRKLKEAVNSLDVNVVESPGTSAPNKVPQSTPKHGAAGH